MSIPKSPKILSRKLDYTNDYMNIFRERIQYEDGRERDYFVLDRKSDFSIIIPIFEDNSTLLVGQHRVPVEAFSWEFSMGTVHGKTPLQVAKQELKEETGYTATSFVKIGTFYVAPGHSAQQSHVYVAKGLTKGKANPEPFEFLTVKRVQLESVKNMIKHGTIKDGPTIVANSFLTDYLTS